MREVSDHRENIIRVLFLSGLATFPFYMLSNKEIQVGHLFFIAAIVTTFVFKPKEVFVILKQKLFRTVGLFLLVVTIVNIFWSIRLSNTTFIFDILIYAFGFALFIVTFFLFKRFDTRILKEIFWILTIAGLIQLIYLSFIGGGYTRWPDRAVAFFYNPNQLGIWSVMALTAVYFIHQVDKQNKKVLIFAAATFAFLGLLTLSRAVYGALGIIIMLGFLKNFKIASISVLATLGMVVIFSTVGGGDASSLVKESQNRMIGKPGIYTNSNIAERGNTRAFLYPKYLILGAGQQERSRFNNQREPHCSPLNIWFSYGIAGLFFFTYFLYGIFTNTSKETLILFSALLLLSLFHYILRAPMLWILLAMVYTFKPCVQSKSIFKTQ